MRDSADSPPARLTRELRIRQRATQIYTDQHGEPPGARRLGPGWDSWEQAREQIDAEDAAALFPPRLTRDMRIHQRAVQIYTELYGEAPLSGGPGPGWDSWEQAREQIDAEDAAASE